jgi:hypothetical protein
MADAFGHGLVGRHQGLGDDQAAEDAGKAVIGADAPEQVHLDGFEVEDFGEVLGRAHGGWLGAQVALSKSRACVGAMRSPSLRDGHAFSAHHPPPRLPRRDAGRAPLPDGQVLAPGRRAGGRRRGGTGGFVLPEPIDLDSLLLVHDEAYVRGVIDLTLPADVARRVGMPNTESVATAGPGRDRRHPGGGAPGAGARDRLQHRRRQPPRPGRHRGGLLRVQRRGGGGAAAVGGGQGRPGAGRRPRRPPGRRHGADLRGRRQRLHLLHARREELPGPQGGQRPGHRPAGRHGR